MKLAVIPARGGSKRIPRKNIRNFFGKPMIAWSIQAALDADVFDRIIVSTDDEEIASIAREFGAEVPFRRPEELSGDHVATVPVINHAINWQSQTGKTAQHVCCIYATAPFIRPTDLQKGWQLLCEKQCDFAFSVTSFAFPIQRAIKIRPEGSLEMFWPQQFGTRSQDLDECYHDAGQFYWGRTDAWLQEKPVFGENSFPLILPRHRVQDIDTPEDWRRAELLFEVMRAETVADQAR